MEPTKNQEKFKIQFILSGVILFFSLFFLQSVVKSAMCKIAEPVPGAHNFFVGELQGAGKAPVVRELLVNIDPQALYLMQAEVFGEPEIHIDVMSPGTGYDNPQQEMVIPAAHNGKHALLFSSGNAPSNNVLFRVFLIDDRSVLIKSINLLRIPGWASWAGSCLVWLVAAMSLVFFFLGFSELPYRCKPSGQ
jgi:hypothetical protein